MYKSRISSCASYFPKKRVTNFDLAEMMDTSDEWIIERTGIKERRIAEKDELTSDMAFHASMKAIEKANLTVDDIDYILFSITYSEQSFPNTAARLQEKLKIKNQCPCLDINAACTGWLYGMELADSLIKTGKYCNILLVGAERPSSFLNWQDRNTAILFGDGCGVAIISRSKDESTIIDLVSKCNSDYINDLALMNGGQAHPLKAEDFVQSQDPFHLHMNGKRIFREAVTTMESLAKLLLERNNYTLEDIKWFIPHQANLRIIEAIRDRLGMDQERVALNIEKYGNTSSATIPSALAMYTDNLQIKKGDLILMTSFGAGLTSSAALVRY